ncbi:MAG: GNAT family N-acetyltransferase [Solirubrobacteraceae bacterium]
MRGERLLLRPATEADGLVALLQEPAVRAWWGENDAASVREELHVSWAIVVGGELAGQLLIHEETTPDYPSVAFDIVLATRFHGQGYGAEALRTAIRHLTARGHHRFQIDPTATNVAAIRCYASVGFRPVGILRAHERDPGGGWRDALLMDLLAGELIEG